MKGSWTVHIMLMTSPAILYHSDELSKDACVQFTEPRRRLLLLKRSEG